MSLVFKPISNGLYSAVVATPQQVALYWLLLKGSPPTGNVDVSDTWSKYSGAYVFVPPGATIADVSTFASALTGVFTPLQDTVRWISWISDTANPTSTKSMVAKIKAIFPLPTSTAAQMSGVSLPFANVQLNIPDLSTIKLDGGTTDAPLFAIKATDPGVISLMRDNQGGTLKPAEGSVNVQLSGTTTGAISFESALWDRGTFYQLFADNPKSFEQPNHAASEVRFFHGPSAGTANSLQYPVFPPQPVRQEANQLLALDITLDPLNVWDGTRTQFLVNVDTCTSKGCEVPVSNYFYATNGNVLRLTPQNNGAKGLGGFSFGKRPKGDSTDSADEYCYLTPVGKFDAHVVPPPAQTDTAAGNTAGDGISNFLCGLTGTEFLLVAPTATVEFVNQQCAYTDKFTTPTGTGTADSVDPCNPPCGGTPVDPDNPLLDDTWTTSWLRILPATTAPTAGDINYGYAVQPEANVYYSSVAKISAPTQNYSYPMALGCRVSKLELSNAAKPPTLLPLVGYGGVSRTNSTPPRTDLLQAFESQIIGTTRYHSAPKDMVNGPTFFDPVSHKPSGGKAQTPEGLLVELNDTGTWKTLHLANSPNTDPPPVAGTSRLAIDGDPVISPMLSNALMNDKLFMVATNPHPLGKQTSILTGTAKVAFDNAVKDKTPLPAGNWFENEIQLSEWTFRLDVGGPGTGSDATPDPLPQPPPKSNVPLDHTIMVFKFTRGLSVVDLVNNAAYWQYWQDFIYNPKDTPKENAEGGKGTAQDVKDVQTKLNQLFCAAKTATKANPDTSVFKNFWAKATDPDWTGILAMNCGLDASDLPIDLQDLLGGISGELRAHHFGITVNQIQSTKNGVITPSSEWAIDKTSMFALVHYAHDYTFPTLAQADDDFFQVLKLDALFENSALVHFDARIAVTIPKLFDQDVKLTNSAVPPPKPPSGAVTNPNVIEINGTYQKHGTSGTVVFETTDPYVFTFNPPGTSYRVLQEVYVTDAVLVPISSQTGTCKKNGTVTPGDTTTIAVKSNFALSGLLLFTSPDISTDANPDPFSYGQPKATPPTGLPFSGYNIAMCTEITNNAGTIVHIGPDRSAFRVQPAGATARPNSVVKGLPLKLQRFIDYPTSGDSYPAGWPVENPAFKDGITPTFALQFQISLGSLGVLSEFNDSLEVDMILGWLPGKTASDADQVSLLMVPPKTMLGQEGFGIEGVLATTFTPITLASDFWTTNQQKLVEYAIYLQNVQVEILSVNLIPANEDGTTQANFTIFSKPGGEGSTNNLGWLATYAKKADEE